MSRKRRFIDAPEIYRCRATISLKDKSTAQCGRQKANGEHYCFQHLDRKRSNAQPAQLKTQEV